MSKSAQFSKTNPQEETKRYFLYARKSREEEEAQALSIPAQLEELKILARKENLRLADVLIEAKTAKEPGRLVFNDMLERIEAGEAQGILAWHPDRLARNAVDAGRIIHLLDRGKLVSLKFPAFWFQNDTQGLFMLNIAFGQSKLYSDNLSANVKRGLRQKVRRGEFPSLAPYGYLNDRANKTIVADRETAPIIGQAFELYAKGKYSYEDIANFLAQNGIKTRFGNPLKRDRAKYILVNPFYTGLFRYGGEIHEGIHEPLVSKKLFDRVQRVVERRGHSHPQEPHNFPFAGFIRCGECGMTISAEKHTKYYKGTDRTVTYVYYRCSKQSKTQKCFQSYVRQEKLLPQVNDIIQKVSLSKTEGQYFLKRIGEEEKEILSTNRGVAEELRTKISNLENKLDLLLDSYLDQIINRETYLEKQNQLMSEKKTLREKLVNLQQHQNQWLEPLREWVGVGREAAKIGEGKENLHAKRSFLRKVHSNLRLQNGRLWWSNTSSSQNPYLLLLRSSQSGRGREKGRAAPLCRPTSRNLAEEVGFEPTIPLRVNTLSRRAH